MSIKTLLFILCLLVTTNCSSRPSVAPVQASQAAAPLQQWEYQILTVTEFVDLKTKTRTSSEIRLNEKGAQGWELVGFDVVTNPNLASARDVYYYLRRPKTSQSKP